MKTITTFLTLTLFMVAPTFHKHHLPKKEESGKMTFSVVYKEKESIMMTSGGIPQKKKLKTGDDFQFDFHYDKNSARFQKKVSIESIDESKKMVISSQSFSFGTGGSIEESILPIDEFDTAVFDFEKNVKIGLATVLKKDILVKVPLNKQGLNLKVLKKTKKILGYKATQAVSEDGNITVWFSDELVINSPWQIEGINGVVLEFEDSERTITATDLTFSTIDPSYFDLPDRKLLELEQYQDLKKEEMDETMRMVQEQMKESGMSISLDGGGLKIKKGNN